MRMLSLILRRDFFKVWAKKKFSGSFRNHFLVSKAISAHMKNRKNAQLFALHEIVSEYTKSILAHLKETIKENKCTWRIRQKYFAAFFLYSN
jgi:hypothetical protein